MIASFPPLMLLMISESTMVLEVVALGTPMGKILQVAERLQAMGKKALGRSFPPEPRRKPWPKGLAFTLPLAGF